MKIHKITCYVLDFESTPMSEIQFALEEACNHLTVGGTTTVDIGEWTDDHELNTGKRSLDSYFKGVDNLDFDVLPEAGEMWFTPDPYPWNSFTVIAVGSEATIRYSDGTRSCMSLSAFNGLALRSEYAGPVDRK